MNRRNLTGPTSLHTTAGGLGTLAQALGLSIVMGAAITACGSRSSEPSGGGRFEIDVAPLQLSTVGGAIWRLEVFAGDPNAGAELVIARDNLDSARFGSARGDISYVAPCDAQAGEHHVRLTLLELRDTTGDVIAPDTWQNPTPVTTTALCQENADTPVTFNLTIMRNAEQGFFDIGVTFRDIFCAAKFDCQTKDGGPLELLHDPDTGERAQTMVLGFACTAGDGDTTWLHMSDVYLECTNGGVVTTHWMAPTPSNGEGNQGPVAPLFFQTAVYVGDESLPGVDKCYWNLAFGLDAPAPPNCVLKVDATASAESWAGSSGQSPDNTVYPFVHYEIPVTGPEGQMACGRHALNDASLRVTTRYSPAVGTALPWERQCGHPVQEDTRVRCGGSVVTVGDVDAAFTQTPSGVSVAFGASRSPVYQVEDDVLVEACCINPCCEESP